MGKKRVGFKTKKGGVDRLKNVVDSDDEAGGRGGRGRGAPEKDLDSFLEDEIDKYNTKKEQESRFKGKQQKKRVRKLVNDSDDEEQEIYGLDVSSDEDDDEGGDEDMLGDSSEGEEGDKKGGDEDESGSEEDDDDDNDEDILKSELDKEGRIPDSRAWGKRARAFHSTDYVDQDFGGFEGEDAELAQQEEDEAKEIQKRLTAELDEADFMDFLPTAVASAATTQPATEKLIGRKSKELLTLDLENLSTAERRKLVERECPEVIHLLDEYKEKLNSAISAKKIMNNGDISDEVDPETKLFKEYLTTKYLCLLNYCINISYFLYLRATNPSSCKGHPVIKVILQYRRLLDELNAFKSAKRLALEGDDDAREAIPTKKLKTKIVSKKRDFEFDDDDDETSEDESELDEQEMGLMERVKMSVESDKKPEDDEEEDADAGEVEHEKRAITREMAKNKGLTPKRKKEQRNPRVKHREKYRKAKIRRKGQVRTPRTEVKKYDGESYGIKSHITKSIKLK